MSRMQFCLATVVTAGVAGTTFAQSRVVFVFDQTLDAIIRMEDGNGDGDAHDAGEAKIFFSRNVPSTGIGNSQGLYALSGSELLATDNFDPENIICLRDTNGDNDAFDGGENTVWFDGMLPGGFTMGNPVTLTPALDEPGVYYMIDNNTLTEDEINPEAVYRLEDLNMDGDVSDDGEVTVHFQLSPAGDSQTTTFDVQFDASGAAYVYDITDPNMIESIDRIAPDAGSIAEWVDSTAVFLAVDEAFTGSSKLGYNPDTDEILALAGASLVAFHDDNGSNTINAAGEIRVIWSELLSADGFNTGFPRDFFRLPDGSIVFSDALQDRIMLIVDVNRDGDYNDLGETSVLYDAKEAVSNGLPVLELPGAIAAALVEDTEGDPDLDGNGVVNGADLLILLNDWGKCDGCPADIDGNGIVNGSDLLALLNAWG